MIKQIIAPFIFLILVVTGCNTSPSEIERYSEYSNSARQRVVVLIVNEDDNWKIEDYADKLVKQPNSVTTIFFFTDRDKAPDISNAVDYDAAVTIASGSDPVAYYQIDPDGTIHSKSLKGGAESRR